MQDSDKAEFGKVLIGMAQIYGRTLTPEQTEIYWRAISSLELETFRSIAVRLLRESQFFPRPADFFRIASAEVGNSWAESWHELLTNRGETRDPLGQRALRSLGGWRVVGYVNSERLPWLAEKFREHYETMSDGSHALLGHDGAGAKLLT